MNYHNLFSNLFIGDCVVGPKSSIKWIQHYVIFIGIHNGNYCFIENKYGYGVRVLTAQEFFSDLSEITRIVRFKPSWNYSRQDLIRYAFSQIGIGYNALNYNCEHFANDVQNLKPESKQADTGKALGLTAVALLIIWGFSGKESKKRA